MRSLKLFLLFTTLFLVSNLVHAQEELRPVMSEAKFEKVYKYVMTRMGVPLTDQGGYLMPDLVNDLVYRAQVAKNEKDLITYHRYMNSAAYIIDWEQEKSKTFEYYNPYEKLSSIVSDFLSSTPAIDADIYDASMSINNYTEALRKTFKAPSLCITNSTDYKTNVTVIQEYKKNVPALSLADNSSFKKILEFHPEYKDHILTRDNLIEKYIDDCIKERNNISIDKLDVLLDVSIDALYTFDTKFNTDRIRLLVKLETVNNMLLTEPELSQERINMFRSRFEFLKKKINDPDFKGYSNRRLTDILGTYELSEDNIKELFEGKNCIASQVVKNYKADPCAYNELEILILDNLISMTKNLAYESVNVGVLKSIKAPSSFENYLNRDSKGYKDLKAIRTKIDTKTGPVDSKLIERDILKMLNSRFDKKIR